MKTAQLTGGVLWWRDGTARLFDVQSLPVPDAVRRLRRRGDLGAFAFVVCEATLSHVQNEDFQMLKYKGSPNVPLDHIVVMSGAQLLGAGAAANREKVVDRAIAAAGIDAMLDGPPDVLEVQIVDSMPYGHWHIVYEGPGLPDGHKMAVAPF